MFRVFFILTFFVFEASNARIGYTLKVPVSYYIHKNKLPVLLGVLYNESVKTNFHQSVQIMYDSNIIDPMYLYEKENLTCMFYNLKKANYKIVYYKSYNKKDTVSVHIDSDKTLPIEIHLDYKKDGYIPIIDRMEDNDSYNIEFNSNGCFHSYQKNINVQKSNGEYYLSTNNLKSLKLTNEEIEQFKLFEYELKYIDGGWCTTKENYKVVFGNETLYVTDGSCNWFGYTKYIEKIVERLPPFQQKEIIFNSKN